MYQTTERLKFIAEALIKMMNVPHWGRSILPEDAEGWLLGPGTGTAGPGAVNENTQSLTHVEYHISPTDTVFPEYVNRQVRLETYIKYF